MSELRWNPLLRTWTMVAANRQNRPNMPREGCPFCPGSGKVPESYTVWSYPNDFPVLSLRPEAPQGQGLPEVYGSAPAAGICEVILYSPDHTASLHDLGEDHLDRLVDLWAERSAAAAAQPSVRYVFVFENRGEAVGVTMPHPHGQLYGYPFVPLKLQVELDSCCRWHAEHGTCMLCEMWSAERAGGERTVFENEHFYACVPYFTDYPYGVFVFAKRHYGYLTDMTVAERRAFGQALKAVTKGMDALFDERFPYMMCMHQSPVNAPEYAGHEHYFHFHVEFYTPWRDKGIVKYYASSESGAWAAANTRKVEETAVELRQRIDRLFT
jgi:UDPglucose--hexose-1-phosphate uridylyltransferase